MKKTKLKLDQLTVKSFATQTADLKGGGTNSISCIYAERCVSGTNLQCGLSACICD
jgi:hypothetical protein